MKFYHGTNLRSAQGIIGQPNKVDVTMGRGELGRGFYAGDNIALAASLAKGKHGGQGAIIIIKMSDTAFYSLETMIIKKQDEVRKHWNDLRKSKTETTFQYGNDVICAPFATIDFATQYKFETHKAEVAMNLSKMKLVK